MAKRRRRRVIKDRELDKLIAKVNATKKPSAKAERAQTTKGVRTYDVTAKDHKLVVKPAKTKSKTLAERARLVVRQRKARQLAYASVVAAAAKPLTRAEIPEAMPLIMAPPLPPLKDGKPNIAALIYAFRFFQQYSSAFHRRKLGNHYEPHYQGLRQKFHEAMKDAGLADFFDWTDISDG